MRASFFFPSTQQLTLFLNKTQNKPFSYTEIGGTASATNIPNYDNDYTHKTIGQGAQAWEKAKVALKNWQHFPSSWTSIYPSDTLLKKGAVVAVLFKVFGLWWCNSARIIYTFAEKNRFGFAYGTLPAHIEKGEEVFWVERDEKGTVSYHIKAFSTPRFWLARLAYPIARLHQRKFVQDSMATMKRLCE